MTRPTEVGGVWGHEVVVEDGYSRQNSAYIEYALRWDVDHLVPEVLGVYLDEWADERLEEEARWIFMEEWKNGQVKILV